LELRRKSVIDRVAEINASKNCRCDAISSAVDWVDPEVRACSVRKHEMLPCKIGRVPCPEHLPVAAEKGTLLPRFSINKQYISYTPRLGYNASLSGPVDSSFSRQTLVRSDPDEDMAFWKRNSKEFKCRLSPVGGLHWNGDSKFGQNIRSVEG